MESDAAGMEVDGRMKPMLRLKLRMTSKSVRMDAQAKEQARRVMQVGRRPSIKWTMKA